jgi:hypothetical protein
MLVNKRKNYLDLQTTQLSFRKLYVVMYSCSKERYNNKSYSSWSCSNKIRSNTNYSSRELQQPKSQQGNYIAKLNRGIVGNK